MKTFNVPHSKFVFNMDSKVEAFIKNTDESKHWCWKGRFIGLEKLESTYTLTVFEGNIFKYFFCYILNKTVSTDKISSIEYLLKKNVRIIKNKTDIRHINRVFKTSSISNVIFGHIELTKKFDSLSGIPPTREQITTTQNLKNRIRGGTIWIARSKERETYNQAKEAFKKINQLLTKLTAENIEKISIEIEKIPLMTHTVTNELKETEKSELEEMSKQSNLLRFDIKRLLNAPKNPSLYTRRIMLKAVTDKKLQASFINANANDVTQWYLGDLKLPENSEISQNEYALQQLKEIQEILIKNAKEADDLLNRVQNRINYLENKNTEEAKKSIQNENADAIREHFCSLFGIN